MNTTTMKPKTQKAFKVARKDIGDDFKKTKDVHYMETWDFRPYMLDTKEIRESNNELGLNTKDGLMNWYSEK